MNLNNIICKVKDDDGVYYCEKEELKFFLDVLYKGKNGKVVSESTLEELEEEVNESGCFVLSKNMFLNIVKEIAIKNA